MARPKLFVGGVHGSGKGSLCKRLVEVYLCKYVCASGLLNWDKKSKQVENVKYNQEVLRQLLAQNTSGDSSYIIDGHFALWNEDGLCESVPIDTFASLGLSGIILTTCSVDIVQKRLKERDEISYDLDRIQELQNAEIEQAKFVSQELNIPLFFIDTSGVVNYEVILNQLDKIMKKYTRENIYSEMLKAVIIRLDFSGVINIGSFVDMIKQSEAIKSKFAILEEIPQRELNVSFLPEDAGTGGLPVTKAQDKTIFRFSKWKDTTNSQARLDIDNTSITLSIDCGNNYKGSGEYSSLMISLMNNIMKQDQFVKFQRLGVRKIDVQILNAKDPIDDYFNDNFTVKNSWKQGGSKDMSTLTDFLHIDDVKFNVIQRIERIPNDKLRLIYDVDSYIYADTLETVSEEQSIESYLNEKMQDKMFDMFVNVVSERYLDSCIKVKDEIDG